MGFLDKAKQLAEQAQQKLDEAQQNFNQSASPQAESGDGAVRYDEHGRPIQEPAAGAAPPPQRADRADRGPEAPPRGEGAAPAAGRRRDQRRPANASPDPFKPLQQ